MSKAKRNYPLMIGWLLVLLAIIFVVVVIILKYLNLINHEHAAQMGDWLGGSTAPLLNLAGFCMIYATFRQQSEDSKQNRVEFLEQKFENNFFNLINLHNHNVNNVLQQFKSTKISDETFFEYFFKSMRRDKENISYNVLNEYDKFICTHYNAIDHLAEHLYFILEWIDDTDVFLQIEEKKEKERYARMLRSHIPTSQLRLLFYHTIWCKKSSPTYMELAIKYRLFQRLKNNNQLINSKDWDLLLNR